LDDCLVGVVEFLEEGFLVNILRYSLFKRKPKKVDSGFGTEMALRVFSFSSVGRNTT